MVEALILDQVSFRHTDDPIKHRGCNGVSIVERTFDDVHRFKRLGLWVLGGCNTS
jgi:hypothetical protein